MDNFLNGFAFVISGILWLLGILFNHAILGAGLAIVLILVFILLIVGSTNPGPFDGFH